MRQDATIIEIAQLNGLLANAGEHFHWVRAQLFNIQQQLRDEIRKGYGCELAKKRVRNQYEKTAYNMPSDMSYRLQFLEQKYMAKLLWNKKTKITITNAIRNNIKTIYYYMRDNEYWSTPIGHIIPREPCCQSFGDSSHCAIGLYIKKMKVIALIPFSKSLFQKIKSEEEYKNAKGEKVHINVLEFIALFLAFVVFKTKYEQDPTKYPPTPVLDAQGDSTSANAWWNKISTVSAHGQNMLRVYAEYQRTSQVCSVATHIAGVDNKIADDISRVQSLFQPEKTHIYDIPFEILLEQVCRKHKKFRSWDCFLPSKDLLLQIRSTVSSGFSTERPTMIKQVGHFARVDSILSNSATEKNLWKYFL